MNTRCHRAETMNPESPLPTGPERWTAVDRYLDSTLASFDEVLDSTLAEEGCGPFDLTFIDADKAGTPEYFRWALQLSRPGSVIIADNVVRDGALADATSTDPSVLGARRFHDRLADTPKVLATTIQTVGCKGYDGFTLAWVRE